MLFCHENKSSCPDTWPYLNISVFKFPCLNGCDTLAACTLKRETEISYSARYPYQDLSPVKTFQRGSLEIKWWKPVEKPLRLKWNETDMSFTLHQSCKGVPGYPRVLLRLTGTSPHQRTRQGLPKPLPRALRACFKAENLLYRTDGYWWYPGTWGSNWGSPEKFNSFQLYLTLHVYKWK